MIIHFVGTGALVSQPHRALPATLIDDGGFTYLFDCGDGTAARLRLLNAVDVDVVAITSVDTSEVAGLLTLGEVNRRSRRKPLTVVGPAGLQRALECLSAVSSSSSSADMFDITEAEPNAVVHAQQGNFLEAVPVMVGPDAAVSCAYVLYEQPLPGRVDAEKATALGIKGNEFARLLAGETVRRVRPSDVIGPARPGRRIVLAGRGRPTEELRDALHSCDVAILAAPFTDDRLELAEEASYLTGWEAAQLAHDENVRLCALQRLGPYSTTTYQALEARQFNKRLVAPHDGSSIRVPLPDLGAPTYHAGRDSMSKKPDPGQRRRPENRSGRSARA